MTKRLLSVRETAEYLGCSVHLLYKKTARREIPFVRWQGRLQFDLKQLDRLIADNSLEPVDWVKKIRGRK